MGDWKDCKMNNIPSKYPEPSTEAKLWVIEQIAKFINDHQADGTFRTLIYDYLNLAYGEAYGSGAMILTNSLSKESYREFVLCESCSDEDINEKTD